MEKVSMKLELTQSQYEELVYFLGGISTMNLRIICDLLDIEYNEELHIALRDSYGLLFEQYEEKFIL